MREFLARQMSRMARALSADNTRGYAAARIHRLTSDWITNLMSADEEIWRDLRALRARSRSLARDDDYFKNYLRKLKNNVVGHKGMTMKVEAQLEASTTEAHGNTTLEKNRKLNKQVETAWYSWSKRKNASANTKLSFCDLERLCIESVAVDGEAIFRFIYGRNDFGFSLQQIDPDWLDEQYNELLPNGNRVVMSVEMDAYDRPVRYHFTPPRHSYYGVTRDFAIAPQGKRIPIDASEILHCYVTLRPGQTRGVPFGHTVIGRIKDLDRYEGAELTNATVSASKMGFISPDVDTPDDVAALNEAGGVRYEEPILDQVSPGMIQKLPRGWKFEAFDPKSPTTVFASYVKQILRGIAAGLGIGYNLLTGDLEGVNYSSLRSAALDERDEWKALQEWMVAHFYEPVYDAWLGMAVGSPLLQVPQSLIEKTLNPTFKPRGWAWVDPEKDATANAMELEAGTATYTEILAEKGLDFEETMERIKYERDYIKTLGLDFVYGSGRQNTQQDGEKVDGGNKQSGSGSTSSKQGSKPS
jgi:lambda family phage portal protein